MQCEFLCGRLKETASHAARPGSGTHMRWAGWMEAGPPIGSVRRGEERRRGEKKLQRYRL
ncbi:hypothetical protein DL95DRAFT_396876, partial [Leptodontidium sp. 2 PMI_412]